MIYIKKGLIVVDEVPMQISVGGVLHTISERKISKPDHTFATTEDYYRWAIDNVDGFGKLPLDVISSGRYIRLTDELDNEGNLKFENAQNPILSDGTILTEFNKDIYDGIEGWQWYEGEIGIATFSTWENIKNWFKL
jgi:hypothetical protein